MPRVDLDHVAPIRASVADAVDELVDELPGSGASRSGGSPTASSSGSRCIVRFLAVLELFKQGLVDLDQLATFGDIVVTWLGPAQVDADALADIDVYEG